MSDHGIGPRGRAHKLPPRRFTGATFPKLTDSPDAMRRLNGLLAALALGLGGAGCGSEAEAVAARSERLADSLSRAVSGPGPAPRAASPDRRVEGISVYLDGTRSMRGFFACDGGATDVAAVIRGLTTTFGVDTVTLFGVPGASGPPEAYFTPRVYDRALRCGEGIERRENPDYLLYQRIQRDSSGRVSVYLTDGVQSASSVATPSPSIRALEGWVGSGKPLAILAFRGTFAGEAWSEEEGGWIGTVRKGDRPFYAFVFAPSAPTMDAFLARLTADLRKRVVAELRFDPGGVRCGAELVAPRYRSGDTAPWSQLDAGTSARFSEASAPLARYTCTLAGAHPLKTVLVEPAIRSYRRWEGAGFSAPHDPPGGAEVGVDSVKVKSGRADRTSVTYVGARLPRAGDHRFGFHAISLAGRAGSLRDEIDSLSTDSDADSAQLCGSPAVTWESLPLGTELALRRHFVALTTLCLFHARYLHPAVKAERHVGSEWQRSLARRTRGALDAGNESESRKLHDFSLRFLRWADEVQRSVPGAEVLFRPGDPGDHAALGRVDGAERDGAGAYHQLYEGLNRAGRVEQNRPAGWYLAAASRAVTRFCETHYRNR